uniref:FGGY_N domain-containing protein n=1 Tax=Syphacia muris TaxID=451379 RepID=A0A0N5AGB0_9BILA
MRLVQILCVDLGSSEKKVFSVAGLSLRGYDLPEEVNQPEEAVPYSLRNNDSYMDESGEDRLLIKAMK